MEGLPFLLAASFPSGPLLNASLSSLISCTEILGGSGSSSKHNGDVDRSGTRSGRIPLVAGLVTRGDGTGLFDWRAEERELAAGARFEGGLSGAGELGTD